MGLVCAPRRVVDDLVAQTEEAGEDAGHTRRGRVGAVLAPLVGLAIAIAPLGLPPAAHRVAVVFGVVVVMWVTEVVPLAVTSLLVPPALVLAGVTSAEQAFAGFGDPLLYLFVGGFFLAKAMHRHGLDRRIARALVTSRLIAGRPGRVRAAFLVATFVLSMWISNTATAVIMLPLVLGSLRGREGTRAADAFASSTLLTVGYAATIGGMGTLVGSPPNGIAVRFLERAGVAFGFVDWLKVGFPVAALIALGMHVSRLRGYAREDAGISLETDLGADAPMSRGERVALVAFAVAVVGWIVPDVAASFGLPGGESLARALPGSVVALMAAAIVFVARDGEGGRVLPWEEATKIEWGIVMLYAGGIALGEQMFETGLAAAMSRALLDASGVSSVWSLTFVLLVFSLVFSEGCSNVACANMVMPIGIAAAVELGVSPIPPALAVGLGASSGFMLPIASAPNAIVYGTGRVPLTAMLRAGLTLDLIAIAAIFLALRILCPLFGWS